MNRFSINGSVLYGPLPFTVVTRVPTGVPTQVESDGGNSVKVMLPVGDNPPANVAESPSGVTSIVPVVGVGVVTSVGGGMQVILPASLTWLALVATAVAVLSITAQWVRLVTALTTA